MSTTKALDFAADQFPACTLDALERLRFMTAEDFGWPVELDFIYDDADQPCAVFSINQIPDGSEASPGPIGSVRQYQNGAATLYAVADAYAVDVVDGLSTAQALRLARYVLRREGTAQVDSEAGRRIWAQDDERTAHGFGRAEDDDADGFGDELRDRLEYMRADISTAIQWPVSLVYGCGDERTEQYALFVVDEAPDDTCAPFPLLSVMIGQRVQGFAAIVAADPAVVLCRADRPEQFADDAEFRTTIYQEAVAEFHRMSSESKDVADALLVALATGATA